MSRVANTYWVDDRIRSQRVVPRTASTLPTVKELSLDLIGTRAEVRRRGGIIPPWVILGMILLATLGLCVTVTIRTHGEMSAASAQFTRFQQNVNALRRENAALKTDINRLSTDPTAIESAARSQLNMARANEIIIPIE